MTSELHPDNQNQIDDIAQVNVWFTYHAPHASQIPLYTKIRDDAKLLAQTIVLSCPRGVERDAAINSLRMAVMFANAGIACQ